MIQLNQDALGKLASEATKAVTNLFGGEMIVRALNTKGNVMALGVWGTLFCPETCTLKAHIPNDRLKIPADLYGGQLAGFQILDEFLKVVYTLHCHVDEESPRYEPGDCLPLAWIRDGIGFIV